MDATRRRFSPVWVGILICTLTLPRAKTKNSFAWSPSRMMTSPFSKMSGFTMVSTSR